MNCNMLIILFLSALLLPFAGGVLQLFFSQEKRAKVFGFLTMIGAFAAFYVSFCAGTADNLVYGEYLKINFNADNCFFLSVNALGVIFYAIYNMGLAKIARATEQQYKLYHLIAGIFVSSMFLIPTLPVFDFNSLGSGFIFMLAWEIMSLASFVLMIFNGNEARLREKSLIYFIAMHLSAVFLMFGIFAVPYNHTLAIIGFIIGFGIKLGLFPGHFYMADGYDALPGASAALTAGVMINMGVYGLWSACNQLIGQSFLAAYILIIVGLISALYGVIWALSQRKMKKALASSSMENMGIIAVAIGIYLLCKDNEKIRLFAMYGCFIHLLNHSLLKGLLFYTTDMVKNAVGETNLNKLGGVSDILSGAMKSMLVGSMGLSAVPLVNGFIGKFLIYYSALLIFLNKELPLSWQITGMIIFVILGMVGALSLFVFVKFYAMTFLGAPRSEFVNIDRKTENFHTLFACRLISIVCIIFGILPIFYLFYIAAIAGKAGGISDEIGKIFVDLSILSLVTVGVVLIIWALRKLLLRKRMVVTSESTWGCGYEKFNSKLEYNSDSLSLSLLWLLDKIFIRKEQGIDIKELYPESFDHDYATKEVIRDGVLAKVCGYILQKLELLQVVQSGVMQRYLWISVLFFVIVLIYAILS